jgi:hypothetical protein
MKIRMQIPAPRANRASMPECSFTAGHLLQNRSQKTGADYLLKPAAPQPKSVFNFLYFDKHTPGFTV